MDDTRLASELITISAELRSIHREIRRRSRWIWPQVAIGVALGVPLALFVFSFLYAAMVRAQPPLP